MRSCGGQAPAGLCPAQSPHVPPPQGADTAAAEPGETEQGPEAETVLTQPILDAGSEESAILVEPVVVDVEESVEEEAPAGGIEEESRPGKDA